MQFNSYPSIKIISSQTLSSNGSCFARIGRLDTSYFLTASVETGGLAFLLRGGEGLLQSPFNIILLKTFRFQKLPRKIFLHKVGHVMPKGAMAIKDAHLVAYEVAGVDSQDFSKYDKI